MKTMMRIGMVWGVCAFSVFSLTRHAVAAEQPQAAAKEESANKVEYTADQESDPFKPEQEAGGKSEAAVKPQQEKPLPVLTVQGIVWGGVFPQAIINNKIVRIGDTIEGARVVDITKSGVIIFFNEREYPISPLGLGRLKDAKK